MIIRGNTVGTPMAVPDFNQENPRRADYIKNRPLDRLLPVVSEEDNDKLLLVKDGAWVITNVSEFKGEDVTCFVSISKIYPSIEAMNSGYDTDGVEIGEFVLVNTRVFFKTESGYSYLTDISGAQGIEGPQGAQGIGISYVYQSQESSADNGENVITIVLTDGTEHSFTVHNGSKGETGLTPVKGTDYWTQSDKAEIISEVLASLPNANGVSF